MKLEIDFSQLPDSCAHTILTALAEVYSSKESSLNSQIIGRVLRPLSVEAIEVREPRTPEELNAAFEKAAHVRSKRMNKIPRKGFKPRVIPDPPQNLRTRVDGAALQDAADQAVIDGIDFPEIKPGSMDYVNPKTGKSRRDLFKENFHLVQEHGYKDKDYWASWMIKDPLVVAERLRGLDRIRNSVGGDFHYIFDRINAIAKDPNSTDYPRDDRSINYYYKHKDEIDKIKEDLRKSNYGIKTAKPSTAAARTAEPNAPDAIPELDKADLPWDKRINTKNRAKVQAGTWRVIPGIRKKHPGLLEKVLAELRGEEPEEEIETKESEPEIQTEQATKPDVKPEVKTPPREKAISFPAMINQISAMAVKKLIPPRSDKFLCPLYGLENIQKLSTKPELYQSYLENIDRIQAYTLDNPGALEDMGEHWPELSKEMVIPE